MLSLRNINKEYITGDLHQRALDNVSLNLRDNEFVAILGPSGSGKTTLLNIIGGLDRYDSGNLIINNVSTKDYKDRDWDSYRNHTIGFVFQSYNLIPHQSILSNVELALTISGISRSQRRERAKRSLEQVGLGDQLHKRPNQLSGGQMQRVAIARALVNDPDILLADEPTGALDTETSVQVMELLKEVAKDRLVVMVTHNPELVQEYATRIVKLRDGKIIDDSDPFEMPKEVESKAEHKNLGKAKMSFLTALSLSFNNLRTKKARTILTSFAGSIGIIGIALILSISTGVNKYIDDIQKETMSSYPITIEKQTVDLSGMMDTKKDTDNKTNEPDRTLDRVYANYREIEASKAIKSSIAENDLASFKRYLDDPESEIQNYIGENGISYSYDVKFDVFSFDKNGVPITTDADATQLTDAASISSVATDNMNNMLSMLGSKSLDTNNFSEIMTVGNKNDISPVVTDNYELIYGEYPSKYSDVLLVLNDDNSIPAKVLYSLGLITAEEYIDIADTITDGGQPNVFDFDYDEICAHEFYLIPLCDRYKDNGDGTFSFSESLTDLVSYSKNDDAIKLGICGILRQKPDATVKAITTNVVYSPLLTDHLIEYTDNSPVVTAQVATPEINVLTGLRFTASSDDDKISDLVAYLSSLSDIEKNQIFGLITAISSQMQSENDTSEVVTDVPGAASGELAFGGIDAAASPLDMWLAAPDKDIALLLYERLCSGVSYDQNMVDFGKINYDEPVSISIYTDTFEAKDRIADCIQNYNDKKGEDRKIVYTDFVALLTSSITTIIDVISYVLIAFVAVSLIVSSIMIGIITYISVLERTKEIGILRALGASKRNISQVFNAETFIVGFIAGVLGIAICLLLIIPINAIIHSLAGDVNVSAQLPVAGGIILVILSVILTLIGGIIPSKKASKKDPVLALRTE